MEETITELAEKHAPENGNWYIDTYDSYIEVGMEDPFARFLDELEERNIDYGLVDDGANGFVVNVYI